MSAVKTKDSRTEENFEFRRSPTATDSFLLWTAETCCPFYHTMCRRKDGSCTFSPPDGTITWKEIMADINKNENPVVLKEYDDGYIVRAMTPSDARIVQGWYCRMGQISRYDLDTCLSIFPRGHGFYIGEYKGEVVASAIRIPWGEGVFYGSYYYVDAKYRRMGFGTRLRDEVARAYVGDNMLCVDAVMGKVAETNEAKFGYKGAFKTGRFHGIAKQSVDISYSGKIVEASEVPLDKLIAYDNKCFVSADNPIRREFLRLWTSIPDGRTYVALSEDGHVIGFGCRRPCVSSASHLIGPLYAESPVIAEAIMQKLCADVPGEGVTINLWYPNEDAVEITRKFGLQNVFDVLRMHVNGDPNEFKKEVFGLTSIDVCGF